VVSIVEPVNMSAAAADPREGYRLQSASNEALRDATVMGSSIVEVKCAIQLLFD